MKKFKLSRQAIWAGMLIAVTSLFIGSCGPTTFDDPIAVMRAPRTSYSLRWKAAKQAELEHPNDPRRIATLRQMVWEKYQSHEFRNYAIDQLIAYNETEARDFISKRLPIIDDWRTFTHIAQIAEKRNWVEITPGLVKRYAVRTPVFTDDKRPERALIEKLNPGMTCEQVILRVFSDPDFAPRVEQRAAAWTLLNRLADKESLIKMLMSIKPKDAMVTDLQAGARDLHVVPDNVQTITWLQVLHTEPYRDFYDQAKAAIAPLSKEQRTGLALRHLATLVHLDKTNDPLLKANRTELLNQLTAYVRSQKHFLKGPTFDGPMDSVPQELHRWQSQLSWADLLVMRVITNAMTDRSIVTQWFTQAEKDKQDTRTEYGGLLRWNDQEQLIAQNYPPFMRRHDRKYYASKKMIIDAYTALAHYHFHAQRYKNRDYAGPGMGDQKSIGATQQFNGLVLTFIEKNRLNVDFYFGPDVIVDLGTIGR